MDPSKQIKAKRWRRRNAAGENPRLWVRSETCSIKGELSQNGRGRQLLSLVSALLPTNRQRTSASHLHQLHGVLRTPCGSPSRFWELLYFREGAGRNQWFLGAEKERKQGITRSWIEGGFRERWKCYKNGVTAAVQLSTLTQTIFLYSYYAYILSVHYSSFKKTYLSNWGYNSRPSQALFSFYTNITPSKYLRVFLNLPVSRLLPVFHEAWDLLIIVFIYLILVKTLL